MSPTAADLEKDMIVAVELLKKGAPFVDLFLWDRRVVPTFDGGFAVAPIPQQAPAAAPPAPDADAELPVPGNPQTLMLNIGEAMATGDMAAVNKLLAGEGLQVVALTTDGESPNDPETPG